MKMLLKRNILETLTLFSCCGSLICIALSCLTNISLITGIFVPIYVIIVFILSTALSFKCIQWVLNLPKPIKYDVSAIVRSFPYFKFVLPNSYSDVNKIDDDNDHEYDTNDLSVISSVLERKLVSSWYVSYISEDIAFPFACKHMLDQIIGKAFEICKKIDTKDMYVDITSILISHLKEYQKAVKRQEKATTPIENHYKKTYNFNNENESTEHCTNILRLILKDLTPWELWETPQSELLIRILSKRLDNYIDETLADPLWLNDQLVSLFEDKKVDDLVVADVQHVDEQEPEPIKEEVPTESAVNKLITTSMVPVLHTALDTTQVLDKEKFEFAITEKAEMKERGEISEIVRSSPLDIQDSPKLREKRGRQGRSEVKIYDRIIEGSVKTWDTEVDLACISVGQDLLASLDGEMTLSRLWDNDVEIESVSPNNRACKSPQPLWFGEDDITLELNGIQSRPDLSPRKEVSPIKKELSPTLKDFSPTRRDLSPKPTEAFIKDIQSTVSQAKNKIGDLQVVPKPSTRDEAAGMMEGLLDFGIAGLKKGLRFTGLHDDTQDKSPSHVKDRHLERQSPESVRHKNDRDFEIHINREEHPPVPPLTKQINVTSQDSCSGSPEPQYEDSADLMTSIARLRSLLHQTNNTNQNVPPTWQCAEETRGRILSHHSTRPIDTAVYADEYDMNADRMSPVIVENNTNNMQRLFARTVTGVFNSIKTAVGAEGEYHSTLPNAQHIHTNDWTYACTSQNNSLCYAISRLVSNKRPGAVDVALDSLHHINMAKHKTHDVHDTLDYDEWCWAYVARGNGLLEICNSAGLIYSHVAIRLAAQITADLAENVINAWLKELTIWIRKEIFGVFKEMSKQDNVTSSKGRECREFKMDETCALIMNKIPVPLSVFGEETLLRSVRMVVSSLTNKQINKDLIYRYVDIGALHFKKSFSMRNTSFDIN